MPLKPNCMCDVCGKPMYKAPRRLAAGERTTCSIECRKSYGYADGKPRQLPDCTCGLCGKVFRPIARFRLYCSSACYHQAQRSRIEIRCSVCEKQVTRFPYDLARNKSGVYFCSRQCAAKARERRVYGGCAYCGKETWLHEGYVNDERHPNGLMFCCRDHSTMYQLRQKGPNKLERDFAVAFPELRFVGDGQFYVNDAKGPLVPDFVHPSRKIAVELFGNFWHEGEDPLDRISRFRSVGWDCLVIWESEFRQRYEEVQLRVSKFLLKG